MNTQEIRCTACGSIWFIEFAETTVFIIAELIRCPLCFLEEKENEK